LSLNEVKVSVSFQIEEKEIILSFVFNREISVDAIKAAILNVLSFSFVFILFGIINILFLRTQISMEIKTGISLGFELRTDRSSEGSFMAAHC
jgi:hypothetical protein